MKLEKQILEQLFELKEDVGVQTGLLRGANKRLDKINGTIGIHDRGISDNKTEIAHQKGINHILTIVFAGVISFVVSFFKQQ